MCTSLQALSDTAQAPYPSGTPGTPQAPYPTGTPQAPLRLPLGTLPLRHPSGTTQAPPQASYPSGTLKV